jgi:uncharacterized membrane protein HdeD (DUF308 family)
VLSTLSKGWWTLALRGLAAVVFGLAALLLPLDTPALVGRVFGAYAILEGALAVLTGLRGAPRGGLSVAEGVSGIAAGLVALAWPGAAALVLLYVIAVWAVASGVLGMLAAFALRREMEGEWLLFVVGALSVALGVAMAVSPGVGLLSLVWLVGLYALLAGLALIVVALRARGLQAREGRGSA